VPEGMEYIRKQGGVCTSNSMGSNEIINTTSVVLEMPFPRVVFIQNFTAAHATPS